MSIFLDLIENATLQAWIWGPLMGVVFGALFAGMTQSPTVNAPVTVTQTKHIYITKIVVNSTASSSSSSNDDGLVMLLAVGLGVAFMVWAYAIYFDLVHDCLWVVLATFLSFGLTSVLVSLLKGQFTSGSWVLYVFSPITVLVACGGILLLAKASFDPKLTQLASRYSFLDFYIHGLSGYGQVFMVLQILGVVLIFLAMVLAGVALLHYLALMNQRNYGPLQGFWIYLTGKTMLLSGVAWLVVMVGLLGLSLIFIEPSLMPAWAAKKLDVLG